MPTDTPQSTAGLVAPSRGRERDALGPQLRVEDGELEGGLGHRVARDGREQRVQPVGRHVGGGEHPRDDEPSEHVVRAVHVLLGVAGIGEGDALAPALTLVGANVHEEDVALGEGAERRAERRDEGQRDPAQLDRLDPHR